MQGSFFSSLFISFISDFGDNTFFIAAILSMKYDKKIVHNLSDYLGIFRSIICNYLIVGLDLHNRPDYSFIFICKSYPTYFRISFFIFRFKIILRRPYPFNATVTFLVKKLEMSKLFLMLDSVISTKNRIKLRSRSLVG